MGCSTVGLSVFERMLREAMDQRITSFVEFVVDNFKDDLEGVPAYSKREWTRKFKHWSINQDHEADYNKLIQDYLKEDHNED